MIVLERDGHHAILYGRDREKDWVIVPYWPCSGSTVRKMAPPKLSQEFVEEAARFADAEHAESAGATVTVIGDHGK